MENRKPETGNKKPLNRMFVPVGQPFSSSATPDARRV